MTLRDVTLRFPTFEFAGVNVDVKLQDGKPSQISATQQRDHLQVSARRQAGDSWSLDIAARDWKLPVGLPLQFDRLEGAGDASASGIEAKKLSGSLHAGSFSGPVAISWKSGWSVAGQGQIDGVDLEPIVALLKREVAMSGKLTAYGAELHEPGARSRRSAQRAAPGLGFLDRARRAVQDRPGRGGEESAQSAGRQDRVRRVEGARAARAACL